MIEFEYDSNKSLSNLSKHGIDFETAQALWNDQRRIELGAISDVESRFLVIGKVKGKFWTAIITYRDIKVRIISVRRSRDNEVSLYEQ